MAQWGTDTPEPAGTSLIRQHRPRLQGGCRHSGRAQRLRPRLRHVPRSAQWLARQRNSPQLLIPRTGMYALWGQDLTPLYGKTFTSAATSEHRITSYAVTLPTASTAASAHDANTVILFCLSCHDGVLTKVGMMQGQTVETLPIVGGNAPTLLAKAAPSGGTPYSNDHPVGQNANRRVAADRITGTAPAAATPPLRITMTGYRIMTPFLNNYPGFLLEFGRASATPWHHSEARR